jgi:PhoH-like ATPase
LRGDNIDNAFVIISEGQNIPRSDMRSILSRMGENTNVVIEGDVKQIDNHLCNEFNNGLN